MTAHTTDKLSPLIYFYMSLLLPNRVLNHPKTVSKWMSVLVSALPAVLFLVLALLPLYVLFEAGFGDGSVIIWTGLILLVYLWAFYAAGFLVFHFMNKTALAQPKSIKKLLHDYGVLALLTQFLLVLIAALILILTSSDISFAFILTIPSIILVMFIYLAFAIFIFGKYLIKEQNKRTVKWIIVFILLQLFAAFVFVMLPLIAFRLA